MTKEEAIRLAEEEIKALNLNIKSPLSLDQYIRMLKALVEAARGPAL